MNSSGILTSSAATENPPRPVPRLPVLDGWRGISIVAVLMAHLLPLGPKSLQLNNSAGLFGMALFFTLSGFLITTTLYFHPNVRTFLIRRFFRIVPGAFLYIAIVLTATHATRAQWIAHLLFYENLPPFLLTPYTSNFWSLCVEMQFYLGIALVFLLFRQRGLALLPFLCVAITINRVSHGTLASIVTLYRVDEILSGATLAWLFHGRYSVSVSRWLARIHPTIPLVLLCLSCHPSLPWMNYLRPYFAAILVGSTLSTTATGWNRILKSKTLFFLATISYGLYIWNELIHHGWFEEGGTMMKYAKRPLGIGINFLCAYLSTFYVEKYFIGLGKRLTSRRA
jgi:peptidoglycan/LPS O-acetylase OafA/YrhL